MKSKGVARFRAYIDPWSKAYCFNCPLADCIDEDHPDCPINQAKEELARFAVRDAGDFLTVGQVAEMLGVPAKTIRWWIRLGQLPARRPAPSSEPVVPTRIIHMLATAEA